MASFVVYVVVNERKLIMISSGAMYLIVKDFDKSVQFYKMLLEREVSAQNMNRFAIFNIDGFRLCIMNGYFDFENPDKVTTKGKVYEEYDDCVKIAEMKNTGKVVINLSTKDLKNEYDRICEIGIGIKITEIRYINARNPYYYFSMKDLDDNTIEITGPYDEMALGK